MLDRAAKQTREPRSLQGSRLWSPISSDGQYVAIDAIATGSPTQLSRELRRLGLTEGAKTGALVSGRLPISSIRQAAQLESLRGMMLSYARTHAGSVGSEADTAHAAYRVRSNTGLDGEGQKVCGISDSYDQSETASTSAADDVQSGDLPGSGNPEGNTEPVDVLVDEYDSGPTPTDEGRAMLQLIHDIAPGAELGFHTAFFGLARFVEAIRALSDPNRGNCDIIVDDIGYNIEPFYQDGPVSNVVDSVVAEGIPYFSSAGNDGENSYQAPFRSSGEPGIIQSNAVPHDFDPSSATDIRQEIVVGSGGTFQIFSFQWTDPSAVVAGSRGADTDINIALVDGEGTILSQSSQNSTELGIPVEGVLNYSNDSPTPDTVHLVVEKVEGPDPDEIKYVYSGANFQIEEYDTKGPTIYGHPMAEGAMAVGAAPFFNTPAYNPEIGGRATLEFFSSKGGIPILFDQEGNEIAPVVRQKPEITAADWIDNTFFGTDLDIADGDPHPNFVGTSAAAPNVAAVAALILQSRSGFTPQEVYDQLQQTANDIRTRQKLTPEGGCCTTESTGVGVDFWSGHGFMDAEGAVPPPDVFDLQFAQTGPATGDVQLTWNVRSNVDIQSYQIARRYFNGPFVPLDVPITNQSALIENVGLGVFTFRVRWTRQDGVQGQRTIRDTLGIESVAAEVTETDQQGRGTVALSWRVPEGTDNYSYQIERQSGTDGGSFNGIGTVAQTEVSFPRQVPGNYRYRIRAEDNQGNTITSSTRQVEVSLDGNAVAIGPYPNPVQDVATLDLSVETAQTVTIEVFTTLGERLYREERSVQGLNPEVLRLNVRPWGSGVYFLRVQGNEFTRTRKLVVAK
jgi:hypothetical protein